MSPSIHRLLMASVNLQGKYNPPDFLDARINVYAYLVLTDSDVILIDTGVGQGNTHIERTFAPQRTQVTNELAKFGVAVSDVSAVVNTHLHFDHCGNNRMFASAKIFVQRAELEVARTTTHTVREWFDYDKANLVPVDGDTKIATEVKLLSSPGHTPGHQSVLIESAGYRSLIVAQAAYTADEYRRGGDPESQAHEGFEQQYLESIKHLKTMGADIAYFSHDSTSVEIT